MKFLCANRIAPDGTLRSVYCLCPTKRTPGLYELTAAVPCILQTELEEAVIKQKEAKAAVDIQR